MHIVRKWTLGDILDQNINTSIFM